MPVIEERTHTHTLAPSYIHSFSYSILDISAKDRVCKENLQKKLMSDTFVFESSTVFGHQCVTKKENALGLEKFLKLHHFQGRGEAVTLNINRYTQDRQQLKQ